MDEFAPIYIGVRFKSIEEELNPNVVRKVASQRPDVVFNPVTLRIMSHLLILNIRTRCNFIRKARKHDIRPTDENLVKRIRFEENGHRRISKYFSLEVRLGRDN